MKFFQFILLLITLEIFSTIGYGQKLSYEDKETMELYKPLKFPKVEGEWSDILQGKQWPSIKDMYGNKYILRRTEKRNSRKMYEIQLYKVNEDLSLSQMFAFEYNNQTSIPNPYRRTNEYFIDKDGNILFHNRERSGNILYKIDKSGVRTGVAGHSGQSYVIKDGKGSEASLTENARFVTQLANGDIYFTDGGSSYANLVDYKDAKITYKDYVLRVLTPQGEIKTVKYPDGNPVIFAFGSNIITGADGFFYFLENYQLKRIKIGQSVSQKEYIAGTEPPGLDGYNHKKFYKLGAADKAFWSQVNCLEMNDKGEFFLFSVYSNRMLILKNKTVSEFCGTSDMSVIGRRLTAAATQKEGSAKVGEIYNVREMFLKNGVIFTKHGTPMGDVFMKIDMNGNISFVR